jgi:exopolysaccharide production protein ExoZ
MARDLPESSMTDFLLNPIVLEFCFGLLLALAWFSGFRPKNLLWSLPGFILITAAPLFVAHSDTNGLPPFARTTVWGLPAVLVLTGFLSVGPPKGRGTRFAVLVGDASYAIYLTHFFVMVTYAKLLIRTPLGALPQTAIIPIVFAACIAVGLMTHLFIERPILAMIRNLVRGKQLQAPRSLASNT